MKELGIEMIPWYSWQERDRIDLVFKTLKRRLPQEMAQAGVAGIHEGNALLHRCWPVFNELFVVEAKDAEDRFDQLLPEFTAALNDVLCLKATRKLDVGIVVSYRGKVLQIPPQPQRDSFLGASVQVHEHEDGTLGVFRRGVELGRYDRNGQLVLGPDGALPRPHPIQKKLAHLLHTP